MTQTTPWLRPSDLTWIAPFFVVGAFVLVWGLGRARRHREWLRYGAAILAIGGSLIFWPPAYAYLSRYDLGLVWIVVWFATFYPLVWGVRQVLAARAESRGPSEAELVRGLGRAFEPDAADGEIADGEINAGVAAAGAPAEASTVTLGTMATARAVLPSLATGARLWLARVALALGLGLLFNWSFLLLARGTLVAQYGVAWIGPITLLFGAAFPFLYFLAGQQHGAQTLVRHLYRRHREDIVGQLVAAVGRERERLAQDSPGEIPRLRAVGAAIAGAPVPVAVVLRYTARRSEFAEVLLETMRSERAGDPQLWRRVLGNALDRQVHAVVPDERPRWVWAVAALNVAASAGTVVAPRL